MEYHYMRGCFKI